MDSLCDLTPLEPFKKNVKNTHGEMLLLINLHASVFNFAKVKISMGIHVYLLSGVFLTLFKWYR